MSYGPKQVEHLAQEVINIAKAQTDPYDAVLELLKDGIERAIIHAYGEEEQPKRRKKQR